MVDVKRKCQRQQISPNLRKVCPKPYNIVINAIIQNISLRPWYQIK